MLELIHTHWRREPICKVRSLGVPTVDMNNVCRCLEVPKFVFGYYLVNITLCLVFVKYMYVGMNLQSCFVKFHFWDRNYKLNSCTVWFKLL